MVQRSSRFQEFPTYSPHRLKVISNTAYALLHTRFDKAPPNAYNKWQMYGGSRCGQSWGDEVKATHLSRRHIVIYCPKDEPWYLQPASPITRTYRHLKTHLPATHHRWMMAVKPPSRASRSISLSS